MLSKAFIEKNGTGIEKNGTGIRAAMIEKNGTGIEKNGTGIERNGTGWRRGSFRCAAAALVLSLSTTVAFADIRGFVTVDDGQLRITIADQTNLIAGASVMEHGYARVALTGMSQCGPAAGLLAEGHGTGFVDAEGHGTGFVDAEGHGTGFVDAEGHGTGFVATGKGEGTNAEGHGTGFVDAEGHGTGFVDAEGHGTGFVDAEGHGTGERGTSSGSCQRLLAEGHGTGFVDAEGHGTGFVDAEGHGTGFVATGKGEGTNAEGHGTGFVDAEGHGTGERGTGSRDFDRPRITSRYFAEVAMNRSTASVILYSTDRSGQSYELAALELPVVIGSANVPAIGDSGGASLR